jgi:hypothetical protein
MHLDATAAEPLGRLEIEDFSALALAEEGT